MQTKHLSRSRGAVVAWRRARAARRSRPATEPTASTFGGQVGGDEDPAARRRTRSARLPGRGASRRAGVRPDITSRSQSTSRPSSSTTAQPAAAARSPRSAATRGSRRSTTSTISVPARSSGPRPLRARARRRHDDRAFARLQRPARRRAAERPSGSIDADEVVAREDQRLLERAGRDDDPLGAEAVEDVAGVDRDEAALVDPDRACRGEHLEALVRRRARGGLVDEHDLPPRGGACRAASRPARPPPITSTSARRCSVS